jgi:hypothetical protein
MAAKTYSGKSVIVVAFGTTEIHHSGHGVRNASQPLDWIHAERGTTMILPRRSVLRMVKLFCMALGLLSSAVSARGDFLKVTPVSIGLEEVNFFPNPAGIASLITGPFGDRLLPASGFNRSLLMTEIALKFDIASISTIPQGATIQSATFTFSVGGTQAPSPPSQPVIQVSGGTGSTTAAISLSDFAPYQSFGTGFGNVIAEIGPPQIPANTVAPDSAHIPISVDVTGIIQSLTNSTTPFSVFGFEMVPGAIAFIWGTTPDVSSDIPSLAVTFTPGVPEPPSALLVCIGLVGVSVSVRCRVLWTKATRQGNGS